VNWDRHRRRWRTRLWTGSKLLYLGCFVSWDTAVEKYRQAKEAAR
jgi:hypothetical protein